MDLIIKFELAYCERCLFATHFLNFARAIINRRRLHIIVVAIIII